MSVEDKLISRRLLQEIYRYQSLDVEEVQITVINGAAYIGGVIRPSIGQYNLNMKEEMRIIGEVARKIPGLRSLTIDAKIETQPKK